MAHSMRMESSKESLSEWMAQDLPPLKLEGRIKMDGLDRLPAMAQEVLASFRPSVLAS